MDTEKYIMRTLKTDVVNTAKTLDVSGSFSQCASLCSNYYNTNRGYLFISLSSFLNHFLIGPCTGSLAQALLVFFLVCFLLYICTRNVFWNEKETSYVNSRQQDTLFTSLPPFLYGSQISPFTINIQPPYLPIQPTIYFTSSTILYCPWIFP